MDPTTEPTKERDASKPIKRCWFARWIHKEETPASPSAFSKIAQSALDASTSEAKPVGGHGTMYRAGLTLSELKPGECGTVRRLFGPAQGRLRMLEMGLTPGTHIRTIRAAAFGGPLDILVRGYQLSLRRDEAAGVWLDDPDDDSELSANTNPANLDERPGAEYVLR